MLVPSRSFATVSTLFIFLSLVFHSTLSSPVAPALTPRVEVSEFEFTRFKVQGCSNTDMAIVQASMEIAGEMAQKAADLFSQTSDYNLLKELQGPKRWLSPDETNPSFEIAPSEDLVRYENLLKRDAAIHFGNVASSFKTKFKQTSSGTMWDEPFDIMCSKEKNSKDWKKYCPETENSWTPYAWTSNDAKDKHMVICGAFFDTVDHADYKGINGDLSKAREAVEKSIGTYKEEYYSETNKGSAPSSKYNTVKILLHGAQHSPSLIKDKHYLLNFNGEPLGVYKPRLSAPSKNLDPRILKPEDRSSDPENWAILAWLYHIDPDAVLSTDGEEGKWFASKRNPSQ